MRGTLLLILSLVPGSLLAVEPWADNRLPEPARKGLVVWLDASVQNTALKPYGLQLGHLESVEKWLDGSGQRRHLVQKQKDARPVFRAHNPGDTILFDGENDALEFTGGKLDLSAVTIFVVAAPVSNGGEFRAFLAGNEPGKNDYTSGINIDQGPFITQRWQWINAEGPGFGGAGNLLASTVDFGTLHQFTLVSAPGPDGVRLFFDGKAAGKRRRTESQIRLDHLTVGARCYNNEGKPADVRGFLDGDIAEVLIYEHALADDVRQSVEQYLAQKYKGVTPIAVTRSSAPGSKPLVSVKDPPPVQMFVPGFTVKQLPVDLPNINNVRYRHDGKLVALGYDGNVYLLSDSDGDGLEDRVARFWKNNGEIRAPIGMALTPPDHKHGQGLFIACKGKLTLLVDTDRDDVADREIIVAQGWKELPHGVDALGVTLDKEGNIYFGLGHADFTNGYLIDKNGKANYNPKGERAAVLKVSADFKKREVFASGIRFPVGLAFNRLGDLFATDQEGATWLPNGNPLDELLHIQRGRHYGFPPRHPKHLPNVVDEPSTFDYGPQHQSVCGLTFNESVNGGPTFGPFSWAGDAIVTGYSRGKLYRTKLVHTGAGYVARNQLIACLNMLTVDACVTPKGELVVATRSGAPDWGSGPTGKGKLYKIIYSERNEPQPVLVWAAGPGEIRVAFDKPLDPARLENLAKRISIERGEAVRAGDRFESLRPGYAVVQQQMRSPRFEVPVLATSISPDRRTLIFTTPPQTTAHHYALTLKNWGSPQKPAEIDLSYDFSGVQAKWQGENGDEQTICLPHLDLAVSRELTRASAEHDEFWRRLETPGSLTLRTKLDLWQMLRPATQPGSRLDHIWTQEHVAVYFRSDGLRAMWQTTRGTLIPDGATKLETRRATDELVPISLMFVTGPGLRLTVDFSTREDTRRRPFTAHRMLLPWAEQKAAEISTAARDIPELKGGSWAKGREVFLSNEAQCAKCHRVNGIGSDIGPDLSNLIHRDYDSVLRDIRTPSAAINPDHLMSVVELTDGRSRSGLLRRRGEKMFIVDSQGVETPLNPMQIETIASSPTSLMPEGLDRVIGSDKMRDLLTFLLTEPLSPAAIELRGEPAPRSRAEVEAILKNPPPPDGPRRKIHIVLATGPKDHGPGEHDYPLWRRRWVKLFDLAENVLVSESDGFPSPALLAKADVVVFYSNNPGWNAERAKELDAFLSRGGGAVFIHYAVDGHRDVDALAKLIGLAWKGGASRFRHGPLDLTFADPTHPITRGFTTLKLIDESYWNLTGDPAGVTLLASGVEEKKAQPLLWAREHGKGRVFVSIPGHYNWSFDDPLFRLLLLRGIAWCAGEPADRFQNLIWVGSRISAAKN